MNFLVLLCVALAPFAQSRKLHEFMTPDEVMGVFHTTHDRVPDYEVVPVVHSKSKRSVDSGTNVRVKAFEHDIDLYLYPTEGYLASTETPLWLARTNRRQPEKIQYQLIPNALRTIGTPMQNVKTGAAVLYTAGVNDRAVMDGFLNDDVIIRSLPQRVMDNVMYGNNGLYEPHYTKNVTDEGDLVYTYHHVVYKRSLPDPRYKDFKVPNIPTDASRKIPEVIYPELLIIIDYNEYQLLGRNVEQAKRYVVSFWNAVDLRYRLLSNPKIRLNIAGIVISLDTGVTPYLENNRVDIALVDADRALKGMADYFYRETRFPHSFYDAAITMTQLDLCNIIFEDICDPATLGYAYVAGACNRNDTKRTSEAVGLVEDNGGFAGIIPAAHELGHLIGARHDGHPTGAADCGPYDGFIMSSGLLLDEKGFEWSECSVKAFYKFLNEDRSACLFNILKPGTPIRRYLPGKLKNLDHQCKKAFGTAACNKSSPEVCTRLECEIPGAPGLCRAIAPAAEGSPCGNGLICLNGKCVLEGTMTKQQNSKSTSSFEMNFGAKPSRARWLPF